MKKTGILGCIAFCITITLSAQVDLSPATFGPTVKKVIAELKSNDGYGRSLYDTITGVATGYFYPTIHYPGAYKTQVYTSPNTLYGKDSIRVNIDWQVAFINKPTGTSNGLDAELSQLAASIKQVFPKAQWESESSLLVEKGITIYFGKRFNDQYKVPDDVHMTLHYQRVLPILSAEHTARLLNQLDSMVNTATNARHSINYCVSAYAHLRQEGMLPEEINRLFAPMLSRMEDRFPGIAFEVLMRLPYDADLKAILSMLSPQAQATARSSARKTVDDYNAQWKPKEVPVTQVQSQQPVKYYQPKYKVCEYCLGKGRVNTYNYDMDYNDYGPIRIYKHSTKIVTDLCHGCAGTGMRLL